MDAVVTLELYEQAVVRDVASRRHGESRKANLPHLYGAASTPETHMQIDIDGAGGEMALAKYLGIYWDCSVNTFHAKPDVGPYHVRTCSRDHYSLIVRPADPDGLYVLVAGTLPTFRIKGCFDVTKAALDGGWWRNPRGQGEAWFIPQASLSPLGSFGWGVLVA
jgi:hypothetical protein